MRTVPVIVIMHHSVGVIDRGWQWNHLTCPYRIFEDQLKWLKRKNYHSISLEHLYEYMKNGIVLPENPVVLTFDDGYQDNWTYAYPLLKKYGFQATIFVSPEFVNPTEEYRPNLEDVWAKKSRTDHLQTTGFLSWREMEEMESEGIIDIQSHAMTHTWYFSNSRIVDFRHPGDGYIWMTWNSHPEKKPYLQKDDEKLIDYGSPVYQYGKSLEVKRYFPDENLKTALLDYVKEKGIPAFFRDDWKTDLFRFVHDYRKNHEVQDGYETEQEYLERVKGELEKSKKIIEERLGKEVRFLCWPGGGTSEAALRIASEAGYFASNYSSREIQGRRLWNIPGENPSRFKRTGTVLFWDGRSDGFSNMKYLNGFLLYLSLADTRKKKFSALLHRVILGGIKKIFQLKHSFLASRGICG